MKDDKLAPIKKEFEVINNILLLAQSSFSIAGSLFINADRDEDAVIKQNTFLVYSMNINWRIMVIELCKLYPKDPDKESKNSHYNLPDFIRKICKEFNDKITDEIADSLINIIKREIDFYSGKETVKRLYIKRDKKFAHTDREDPTTGDDGLTFENIHELIRTAQYIVNDVHNILFGSTIHYGYTIGDPNLDLDKIVKRLALDRRQLLAYQLQHAKDMGIDPKEILS